MTVVYSRKRLRAQAQATKVDPEPKKPSPVLRRPPRPLRKRRRLVQLHLDAGQSDISAKNCPICGLFYTPGVPADEALHRTQHAATLRTQRPTFRVLPGARVLLERGEERYFCVRYGDDVRHVRRVEALDAFVTRQLGGREEAFRAFGAAWRDGELENWLVVVCVRNGCVVGYLYAERVGEVQAAVVGFDGVATVGEDREIRTFCGVRKVWVAEEARRTGVASEMIDVARRNLVYGYDVAPQDVAFTATTTDGGLLGAKYARRCGQSDVWVY